MFWNYMMCTVSSAEGTIKKMPLERPGPGPAQGASESAWGRFTGTVTVELEEHGGYFCAGCKKTWSSLRSLNHHRASPYMRGTECEEVKNSRELRNIFRDNLATGQDSRLPLFSEGEGKAQRETTGIHQSEVTVTSPTCQPMSITLSSLLHITFAITLSSLLHITFLPKIRRNTAITVQYYVLHSSKKREQGPPAPAHVFLEVCNTQYLEVLNKKWLHYYHYYQLLHDYYKLLLLKISTITYSYHYYQLLRHYYILLPTLLTITAKLLHITEN